jgi:hypothetical protein
MAEFSLFFLLEKNVIHGKCPCYVIISGVRLLTRTKWVVMLSCYGVVWTQQMAAHCIAYNYYGSYTWISQNTAPLYKKDIINRYPANVENMVSSNPSKWQMGFKLARLSEWMNQHLSAATEVTLILPTWRIWWAPNARKLQTGFKLAKIIRMTESNFIHSNSITPYPANVENMVIT